MTKPIHEVWEVADYLIRLSIPHLEKLASPDYIVNEDRRPIYKVQLESSRKSLEMLRRVLLERCKREYSMWIAYLWGRYGINVGKTMLTFLHPGEVESWAAVLSFMAYELERQTKEQEGGEG